MKNKRSLRWPSTRRISCCQGWERSRVSFALANSVTSSLAAPARKAGRRPQYSSSAAQAVLQGRHERVDGLGGCAETDLRGCSGEKHTPELGSGKSVGVAAGVVRTPLGPDRRRAGRARCGGWLARAEPGGAEAGSPAVAEIERGPRTVRSHRVQGLKGPGPGKLLGGWQTCPGARPTAWANLSAAPAVTYLRLRSSRGQGRWRPRSCRRHAGR